MPLSRGSSRSTFSGAFFRPPHFLFFPCQLKPTELLAETQKAIDPTLHERHQEIIKRKKKEKELIQGLEVLTTQFQHLEQQAKGLEKDVQQINEKKQCEKQIELLHKKRPIIEWNNARDVLDELKLKKKELDSKFQSEQQRQKPVNDEIKSAFLVSFFVTSLLA